MDYKRNWLWHYPKNCRGGHIFVHFSTLMWILNWNLPLELRGCDQIGIFFLLIHFVFFISGESKLNLKMEISWFVQVFNLLFISVTVNTARVSHSWSSTLSKSYRVSRHGRLRKFLSKNRPKQWSVGSRIRIKPVSVFFLLLVFYSHEKIMRWSAEFPWCAFLSWQ